MIIIPARLASTRFRHKILCDINGEPMCVYTAKNASRADKVVLACDDESVANIAKERGINAILTSKTHQSGSDRINEACQLLGLRDDEIIINIQADEPFFELENLLFFKDFAQHAIKNGAFMASVYKSINYELANDENLVKVVLDSAGFALYFSRSIIPFVRDSKDRQTHEYFGHIGIYAYSVAGLREFCGFSEHGLENAEKLEQLRALSAGKKIAMLKIATNSVGIDTKQDYINASKKYNFKAIL